jgi:hypothetical protein
VDPLPLEAPELVVLPGAVDEPEPADEPEPVSAAGAVAGRPAPPLGGPVGPVGPVVPVDCEPLDVVLDPEDNVEELVVSVAPLVGAVG